LKPCAALIFAFMLQFVISSKLKHNVALFLDEFTNFGLLPDFPAKLSLSLRHNNLPAALGLQDYSQAERLYQETATLIAGQPATRIYFKPQQLAQAKIISEALGKETYYERRVDSDCKIVEDEIGRDLMTPGAVMALKDGHTITFLPKGPPLMMKLFAPGDHDWATQLPAPERRKLEVKDELVRICEEASSPTEFQLSANSAENTSERVERQQEKTAQKADPEKEHDRQVNEYGDRMPSV
ncbi:MAG: TraM recognition domain-containing protein, partial [Terriglobales bacterium]